MKIAALAKGKQKTDEQPPFDVEQPAAGDPAGSAGHEPEDDGASPVLPKPQGAAPTLDSPLAATNAADIDSTTAAPAKPAAKKGGILLRGSKAKSAVQTEQAKAEAAQASSGFRFWLEVGGEARISFIDGELDGDGMIKVPFWYEHRLMIGGRLLNIVCYETVENAGPCPVCMGGHRTQLVAGFSICNHTPFTYTKGPNTGKTIKNRRQQFVAPRTTFQTLQTLSAKRGGLKGHVFDVYRKEKKDARVGSVFDYYGTLSPEQIKGFGDEWKPYDWDDHLKLLPEDEMTKLASVAVPYTGAAQSGAAADLSDIEV